MAAELMRKAAEALRWGVPAEQVALALDSGAAVLALAPGANDRAGAVADLLTSGRLS